MSHPFCPWAIKKSACEVNCANNKSETVTHLTNIVEKRLLVEV